MKSMASEAIAALREQIASRSDELVLRLFKAALGEVDATPSQISAAKLLLGKIMPDVSAVDVRQTAQVYDLTRMSREELLRIIAEPAPSSGRMLLEDQTFTSVEDPDEAPTRLRVAHEHDATRDAHTARTRRGA